MIIKGKWDKAYYDMRVLGKLNCNNEEGGNPEEKDDKQFTQEQAACSAVNQLLFYRHLLDTLVLQIGKPHQELRWHGLQRAKVLEPTQILLNLKEKIVYIWKNKRKLSWTMVKITFSSNGQLSSVLFWVLTHGNTQNKDICLSHLTCFRAFAYSQSLPELLVSHCRIGGKRDW